MLETRQNECVDHMHDRVEKGRVTNSTVTVTHNAHEINSNRGMG